MREYCKRCRQLTILKKGVCKFCNGTDFVYTTETLRLQFKLVIDHSLATRSEDDYSAGEMDGLLNQLIEITQKHLEHSDKSSK